jgi:hypothetical protein
MIANKNSGWRLFLRSLLPSAGSLAGSFTLTVLIIGLHLFLLSNDQSNLLLPHLTGVNNDQLAEVYNNTIQARLDEAFENTTFGVLSSAVVWGIVGLVVYSLADFIFMTIKELRTNDTNINMPRKNQVINHPLKNQIIIRLFWRFFIGLSLIVATLALYPYITHLFKQDVDLLRSSSALQMLKHLGISLAGWMAIFHLYVVLFRLFVFRTRVFGEIIY